MKKHFFYLCMCALFVSSCSDESSTLLDSEASPTLRVAGDGEVEVLGYGYDITDDFLGETATKKEVVDVKAFKKGKDGHRFTNPFVGIIYQREFYGSTSENYINDVIRNSKYEGSVAFQATQNAETKSTSASPITSASFSGGVTRGSNTKYSYSSKYSFGRGDVIKKQRQYILDRKPSELTDYLSISFKEDLNLLSADDIVLKYGTHVLLDITVGGMYTASYKSAVIETSTSITKTKSVQAGVKLGFKAVGLDFSTSQSTSETNTYNSNNTDWKCVIDCWGGNTNGVSTSISATEPPKTTFNWGAWTQSVDDTHSRLVDVNWNATYPIYDFIVDATKKSQVKAAVEKYIKSKQLQVLEIVPLYQFSKNGNFHYNTAKTSSGWSNQGITCYVQLKKENDAVPLYQFSKGGKFHYNTATTSKGWSNQGITCYVYNKQIPGTVPLYQFSKNGEFHYNTEQASKGWTNQGITCYVFPGENN